MEIIGVRYRYIECIGALLGIYCADKLKTVAYLFVFPNIPTSPINN